MTTPMSPLVTVMSQLFPMFVGGTLNLKEITANKNLITNALQHLAATKRGGTKFLSYCEDKGLVPQHSEYYTERDSIYVNDNNDKLWKWFADNFLSLTFVKGEGLHFSEHSIHRVLCVATDVTKLYNRFQIASDVTKEELDTIHSLKHKFEEWGCGGEFGSAFNISLKEIAIMQRLLSEYHAHKQYSNLLDVSNTESNQYWILNTRNRIKMNIESCLEYVDTLV